MLEAFAAWLGATPLTAFLENQAWAVPTIQVVHILAITVVMGAAVIVNLRILGVVETGQSLAALTRRFVPPSIVAILVLAVTGLLLIAGEPTRAMFRYVFWAKMGLVALALALSAGILAGLNSSGAAADSRVPVPAPLKVLAVLALMIWLAIIVAGRWIGYAQGWPGSPQ
jgi:Na+-transporting NADH:ubiquinone oxidoreductase subunit NqrD